METSFDPICPKTLIKIGQLASEIFKFESVKFSASYSNVSGLIWPEIQLIWALMPILLTSNFDDDSIKNEWASMETRFSHYKSIGDFLDTQGQLTL